MAAQDTEVGGGGGAGWMVFVAVIAVLGFYLWWQHQASPPAPVVPGSEGAPTVPVAVGEGSGGSGGRGGEGRVADDGPAGRGPRAEEPAWGPHLFLGNPSDAIPDPREVNNFLMVKPEYSLSYNDSKGTANWVSWRLRREDLGDAPRKPQFDPDALLPAGFTRIVHRDYSGSGFDRGHLVPHSDRDSTQAAAWSTFVMTNVIPQAPNVNQRSWNSLEQYCRRLVGDGKLTLFVIAGPWGKGGVGTNGRKESIANGRVTVPAMCWKVVVAVPTVAVSESDRVPSSARVIAVRVPNDESIVTYEWAGFRVTPAELERETGLRFFTALRPDVADALRQRLDRTAIEPARVPRTGSGGGR